MKIAIFTAFMIFTGCVHPIVPAGGEDCDGACKNFSLLKCQEAVEGGEDCTVTCTKVMRTRIIDFDPKCVANATTVDDVRKCPSVTCERQ